jgi:fatty acyl-CoA reductase
MRAREPAAAFFDVDGTLVLGTVLHYYVWIAWASHTPLACVWRLAALATKLPYYGWLDHCGRDRFLRVFYRNYAGHPPDRLRSLQEALFHQVMGPRLLRQGEETVQAHRQAGRRVVMLSGSLRFLLEPLARHLRVDELICNDLAIRQGVFTGELTTPPLSGHERARQLRSYGERHSLDLSACFAYGDSVDDIPMLASVGHPTAVNPSRSLRREAQRRGWPIACWHP